MTRIPFATVLLLFALCASLDAQPKPNIVFIFADDYCYELIAAQGNDEIQTPNLDRLVRGGLSFTRAYNQGSWTGAVCVASRTMLNTGRFLWHAEKLYRKADEERAAGRFWSREMNKAGYDTYFTGKWHVKANAELAFDHARHVRPGMPNDVPEGYNRPIEGQPEVWKPWDRKWGGFWKGGKHWSEVVGDDSVEYIKRAAKEDRPFFMYLAFNAPHDPRQSPKSFVDRYPLEKVKVPENYLPEYPYKDAIGCSADLRDEKLAPFPRTEYAVKVNRQEYYAIITHMDEQVGRILDAVEQSGKAENTYIVFTADHGLAVGHHGLLGKQNLYEHSVRVPFIVQGPGVPVGQETDAWIYLQDIMPTTIELAGAAVPAYVEFTSLVPHLRGKATRSGRPSLYGAYRDLQRSVVLGDHKLILYPEIKQARLYNTAADPLEMVDLSGRPDSATDMKKLFAKLLELQKEVGDELDLGSAYPRLLN